MTSVTTRSATKRSQPMDDLLERGSRDAYAKGGVTLGGRLRRVKRWLGAPAQIREGLRPARDQSERLGLPRAAEEPPDLGTRREPERRHDVLPSQQGGRLRRAGFLARAPHQLAQDDTARSSPDGQRRVATHRRRVDEREQHEVARLVSEVPEEAVPGAPR